MDEPGSPHANPPWGLDGISTRWSVVNEPVQFVVRYASAIRSYLDALLKDSDDAEEVSQEFLLTIVRRGFVRASPDQGRFRFYLKKAVRNAALTFLRRKHAQLESEIVQAREVRDESGEPWSELDQAWLKHWQICILDRAWRALENHEHQAKDNFAHTVLRLAVDHPHADSEMLAALASERIGRPMRADAFRKQLSRARRRFAELVLEGTAETLENPTPELLEEELIEVGLFSYVRDFLPPDWGKRARPTL